MSYVTIVDDSPAGSIENLDRLMTEILPDPDGLAARYAGVVDGSCASSRSGTPASTPRRS